MQTEECEADDEQIKPETSCTEFLALYVGPRVGISQSASETDDRVRSAFSGARNFLAPLNAERTLSYR